MFARSIKTSQLENKIKDTWYVYYLKSRSEKKVAEFLDKQMIPFYLPLMKSYKQWSDRRVVVEEPLIRGYIFIPANIVDEGRMVFCPGIVNLVKFKGKNAQVTSFEIEQLRDFLGEHTIEQYEMQQLMPGAQIEVRRGAFQGKKGELINVKNNMAIIQLNELGIELKIKIHTTDLKV